MEKIIMHRCTKKTFSVETLLRITEQGDIKKM